MGAKVYVALGWPLQWDASNTCSVMLEVVEVAPYWCPLSQAPSACVNTTPSVLQEESRNWVTFTYVGAAMVPMTPRNANFNMAEDGKGAGASGAYPHPAARIPPTQIWPK